VSTPFATRRGLMISALCAATFLSANFAAGQAYADGDEPMLTITGELTYRQRIALPSQAVAFVEVRAQGVDDTAQPVAQTSIDLAGKQVPIAFSIELPRVHLENGTAYQLGGGILVDGQVNWRVIDPVSIETSAEDFNAGMLMMAQQHNETPQATETQGKEALAGEWHIVKIGDDTIGPDANATLNFAADGFSGRLCNSFRGDYTVDGTTISFGQTAATLMACPDPLGRQEQALFKAFESAASFKIAEDGNLNLVDDKDQILVSAQR